MNKELGFSGLKPYKKSYPVSSHREIKGWRENSSSQKKLKTPIKISTPFRVKSLGELHSTPRYPDYKPERILPLISPITAYLQKNTITKLPNTITHRESSNENYFYDSKRVKKNSGFQHSMSTKSNSSLITRHSKKISTNCIYDSNYFNIYSW